MSRLAARDLRRLPADAKRRVTPVLSALAEEPRPHGIRKLTDTDRVYRLRVGAYRVIYEVDDDRQVIVIVERVVRRSESMYRRG